MVSQILFTLLIEMISTGFFYVPLILNLIELYMLSLLMYYH